MILMKRNLSAVVRCCSGILNIVRSIPLAARSYSSYEGISRTHAEIINKRDSKTNDYKMIEAYSQLGFRLTDTSFVLGPMILIDNHCFCWNIKDESEIDHKSLEFFMHIHPPLDILVIGYSDSSCKEMFSKNIHLFGHLHNIAIELLPCAKALTTYNFLVNMRRVAGAFLPPQAIYHCRDEMLTTGLTLEETDHDFETHWAEEVFMRTHPAIPKYVRKKRKITSEPKDVKQITDGENGENEKK